MWKLSFNACHHHGGSFNYLAHVTWLQLSLHYKIRPPPVQLSFKLAWPYGEPCSGHHRSIQNEIRTCPRPVRQGRVDTLGFANNLTLLKCIVEKKYGKNSLSVPQPLREIVNFLFASAHSWREISDEVYLLIAGSHSKYNSSTVTWTCSTKEPEVYLESPLWDFGSGSWTWNWN